MIERRTIEDREQWLEWRKSDVTASDVAALFNLSPFKSRFRLWAEKTGRAREPRENMLMRRGRWLEPAVVQALKEEQPAIGKIEWPLNLYVHDPELRLGGTPDALATRPGSTRIIECKVVSRPVFDAWQGECPIYYQLQAATNAMLLDAELAWIACLVIDTYSASLEVFHVERNAEAEERIREGVRDFWWQIAGGAEPEPEYGADLDLVMSVYRTKPDILAIDLSHDNRLPDILAEREGLQTDIKAACERVDAIKAEIVHKLNGAPAAICGDWKITNKMQHRQETIIPASDFSVLRVTRKRQEAA